MKRLLFVVLSMTLLLTNISAAGQKEMKKTEPIVLSFWNGFTGPDGVILKELVDDFNRSQSEVEVEMDIMGWDILSQKLPPSIATKTAPDFALLIGDWIPQYIANGSIKTLDDFWTSTELKEEAYLRNVLDLGVYQGKYYSLPMQFNLIYLFWNKSLFEAAGLDPEKAPQTMQELTEYAQKLTDSNNNQYGFGLPVKGAPQYWTSLFWNNGGELFDLSSKKSELDSPENIESLTWIRDLAVNKKVTPRGATGAELENLFMSGKLGMYINGPWMIGGLRENGIDFGVSVAPKGSVRQQVIGGNIGFVIPSSTSDENTKAVHQFIKYWMSDDVLKEWSMRNGFPAWSKNVLADTEIQADEILGTISPMSTMGRAYNPEAFEGITALDNEAIWPMIESVISEAADPEEAIKTASEKIDSIFSEYK